MRNQYFFWSVLSLACCGTLTHKERGREGKGKETRQRRNENMGGGGDELLLLIVAAYLAASPSRPHFCRIAATNPNWGEEKGASKQTKSSSHSYRPFI